MNFIALSGRLGKDLELRYVAGSGKAVSNFSIAVERPFSKNKETDWFNIAVWGTLAENCAKYLHKGSKVLVKGYLMTRSYDDAQGIKRYVTEVVSDQVEFLDGKPQHDTDTNFGDSPEDNGFQSIDDDDCIPFV